MREQRDITQLTPREREVLKELAEGQYYKEIACKFDVCIDTVKKHCKNIYRKLEVNNRTDAARFMKITDEGK